MQNPGRDQKPDDKKTHEAVKKDMPGKNQSGQKPQTQQSDKKPVTK
jgi:hypothetical protein